MESKKEEVKLDFSGKNLTAIPEEVYDNRHVTSLDLSSNSISEIPIDICRLTNLKSLNLFSNEITSLPEVMGQLFQLTSLDLSYNRLNEIPESFCMLINLQELNLRDGNRGGKLSCIPPVLFHLKALKKLNLPENNISTIPHEIARLTNLMELDLSDNNISTIPREITHLTNLENLELSFNTLREFPPAVCEMMSLKSLWISGNPIRLIPPEIANLKHLEILHLSGTELSQLPAEIANLSRLTVLNLSGNNIKDFPIEITNYPKLENLRIHKNSLKKLPKCINKLNNLKFLLIAENEFSEFPEEVYGLRRLRGLDLTRNNLESLPRSISKLDSLEALFLRENKLSSIPPELVDLDLLKRLDLSNNQLQHLPNDFGEFSRLEYLGLNDNQFEVPSNTYRQKTSNQIDTILKYQNIELSPGSVQFNNKNDLFIVSDTYHKLHFQFSLTEEELKICLLSQDTDKNILLENVSLLSKDNWNQAHSPIKELLRFYSREILEKVSYIKTHQIKVLELLYRFNEAKDLMHHNPILLVLIAIRVQKESWQMDKIKKLLGQKQNTILGKLYPKNKLSYKTLRKIDWNSLQKIDIDAVETEINTGRIGKRLNHMGKIHTWYLRAAMEFPELSNSNLMIELTKNSNHSNFDTLRNDLKKSYELWSDCIELATKLEMKFPCKILNRIKSYESLEKLNINWELKTLETGVVQGLPFPKPPIEGNNNIVPVTTMLELALESKRMNHCVFELWPQIYEGSVYVYQVLNPERGTLALENNDKGIRLKEFKLQSNENPNEKTRATIVNWYTDKTGKEIEMGAQFYLDQIEKLDNPQSNKPKIRSLIEKAINENNCLVYIHSIAEAIREHFNDLNWIRGVLESEESKLKQEYCDALDYVILGDTIAEYLDDREWALSCYDRAANYVQSLWDYHSIIYSMFENLSENERTLTLLEKAYQYIEKEDPCSSEVSAMASLTVEITGNREKAVDLFQKALDTDVKDGICWDDRLSICFSIATDLKDHRWAKVIMQQLKPDVAHSKVPLSNYQARTIQSYLSKPFDPSIKIIPSINDLRNYTEEIIDQEEVYVTGVVSDVGLPDHDGYPNCHVTFNDYSGSDEFIRGSIILKDDTGSIEVFAVPSVLSKLEGVPKISDILFVRGTIGLRHRLMVINAKSIQIVDSNISE
jgi:Leucine-rich repeat (LRR) protein